MAAYLKTYFKVLAFMILTVGLINFTIDPLWYSQGNRLTGINPPWNERIQKTNLLLQHSSQDYNCLIFGTSRTTLLDTSLLKNDRCFNYSFSGGKVEEFVNYANYAKQKGFNPTKVYVEIEPESLNQKRKPREYEPVTDPMPMYQAYFFSWNAFQLSIDTITKEYSFARLYNSNFQGRLAEDIPAYAPKIEQDNDRRACDLSRIRFYQALKNTFPSASIIGFVAPVSAWFVFNEQYSPGLMNCQLAGIQQISQQFDAVYDFAVPSALTVRKDNTYDGNHYYPKVYEEIAAVLEGRQSEVGIRVDDYALADYQQLYGIRLRRFLARIGAGERWRG